jgi:anti-sigma B factor antagonist
MSFFSISENVPVGGLYPEASGFGPDELALIVVSGELDYGASPRLRARIAAYIDGDTRHLVLDLSEVTFIDSTAIGVLAGAAARLRATGSGSLRVVCADDNARVLRIFDIAGVAGVLDLHGTRGDAFAALARLRAIQTRGPVGEARTGASSDAAGQWLPTRATTRRYAEQAAAANDGRRDARRPHAGRRHGVDELA